MIGAESGRRGGRGYERDDCRNELVVAERQRPLSFAEGVALRAHLSACASCKVDRRVLADFGDDGAIEPRDGARIERLAAGVRRSGWRASRRGGAAAGWRRSGAIAALAAAVVLIAGTASATVWWRRHQSAEAPAPARVLAAPPSASPSIAALRRRVGSPAVLAPTAEIAPPTPPAAATQASLRAPSASAAVRARRPARVAVAAPALSAASLLRDAGALRRNGERDRAIAAYRRLEHEYPRTQEATVAAVSLGGALLEAGFPRAALGEYDRYLASSRGGVLIPEALYGRARALAALGDRDEERRTWERLLGDFPASAYAPLARRRLEASP